MRKFILTLIFVLIVQIWGYSQTITLTPIGNHSVSGIPIKMEHYVTTTNSSTFVRVFRTHYGNGNTSQYAQYPSTRSEMDKLFNTTFAATTWWWQGNINGGTSLNFTAYTTLTSAGVSVPSGGDYYATEVTFNFVAAETGTYSFGITSDDGSDLTINGTSVIEYYGGKGIGTYKYGSYSMTKGNSYTIVARMQEYGGGDGLIVKWKRPSQSSYSLQLSEVGTTSSTWTTQSTQNTNSSGQATWSNSSSWPYRVTINVSNVFHTITTDDMNYMFDVRLGTHTISGWDFYTCDCNNSSTFTLDDIEFCYTLWLNGYYHNKYIFTQAEKTTIESNPNTNYYNTYSPSQNRTIQNESQFYIMGTGKHKTTTQYLRIE